VPKKHCQIRLSPAFANLSSLERFITECPFLEGSERDRALLVTSEYFDNIVTHGRSVGPGSIDISVDRDDRTAITIRYTTYNFDKMVRAHDNTRRYFDRDTDRYRGLGLTMCRNLSSSITYKKGLFRSSVIIIL
jgi:anti-sigma regulatory factor (Ser/Thr protein kinase)